MKVVIVAKTRVGKGACIGGITFEGDSVRLVAVDEATDECAGMEYEVGEVWEVKGHPAAEVVPPHVENFIVTGKRRLPPMRDPAAFICRHMPPVEGSWELLYEGLTQATRAGAMYVAERTGIPSFSTMFWIPDQPLPREDEGKRIRYRYPGPDGGRTLTFVGFQEPLSVIEAGTLLRVSLAHWWRPSDMPDRELRCYAQLSGWFLPGARYQPGQEVELDTAALSRAATGATELAFPPPTPERCEPGPDLELASDVLRTVFGFDDFWPLQEEIITNILTGRDTLAIMPTGSGKSLCYQLPALIFEGLTVVVSPLISLMQDQVDQLRELEIPALYLNSTLSHREHVRATKQIRQGKIKLVYVAPETLRRPETLVLLDQCQVCCLTVDEAHCISEWGHDFRPDYRQLREVRQRQTGAVCFALTATATLRVQEDIKQQLGMLGADTFLASFDRVSLFLAVQPKVNGARQLRAFLEAHRDQSGIIYCATKRRVDALAAGLAAEGWSVLPYHAGLDDNTRQWNQRQFIHDRTQIVVATIAFGMGIDKPDVRFVVHYDAPQNLECYYQQIGRAGRDGLRADCLLLYSRADIVTIKRLIGGRDGTVAAGAQSRLETLIDFAKTSHCRRRLLLAYFDEPYEAGNCGMCDNCLAAEEAATGKPADLVDVTTAAQKFLSCAKRTGELFGAAHIIAVLRGSKAQRVLKWEHDRLSTYGIGREYSARQWRELARQFVQQGLLIRDDEHGSLKLTPKAYQVMRGEEAVWASLVASTTVVEAGAAPAGYDSELFALLRAKRQQIADSANVPPYVIFHDRSLQEMASYYPQSPEAFAAVHGVGSAKLKNYAGDFLPIIREYCRARGIPEVPRARARIRSAKRASRIDRALEVAGAYNGGQSVDAIAESLGITKRTVLKYLWRYAQAGHTLRLDGLLGMSNLSAKKRAEVLGCFEQLGTDYLRPVHEALNETVAYDELHLLRIVSFIRSQEE
jgi:ATP-dependent DNA helicase RecQ